MPNQVRLSTLGKGATRSALGIETRVWPTSFWLSSNISAAKYTPFASTPSVGKSAKLPSMGSATKASPVQPPAGFSSSETANTKRLLLSSEGLKSVALANQRCTEGSYTIRGSVTITPESNVRPEAVQNSSLVIVTKRVPLVLAYTLNRPLISSTNWSGPAAPSQSSGV